MACSPRVVQFVHNIQRFPLHCGVSRIDPAGFPIGVGRGRGRGKFEHVDERMHCGNTEEDGRLGVLIELYQRFCASPQPMYRDRTLILGRSTPAGEHECATSDMLMKVWARRVVGACEYQEQQQSETGVTADLWRTPARPRRDKDRTFVLRNIA